LRNVIQILIILKSTHTVHTCAGQVNKRQERRIDTL